jgi:hypothetical protein
VWRDGKVPALKADIIIIIITIIIIIIVIIIIIIIIDPNGLPVLQNGASDADLTLR